MASYMLSCPLWLRNKSRFAFVLACSLRVVRRNVYCASNTWLPPLAGVAEEDGDFLLRVVTKLAPSTLEQDGNHGDVFSIVLIL